MYIGWGGRGKQCWWVYSSASIFWHLSVCVRIQYCVCATVEKPLWLKTSCLKLLRQGVVHEYQDSPDRQYSSSDDPYTQLTYSDLSKQLKLVNEHKCLAFVSQLLLLLGRKCRVDGCDADLATTYVDTDWICSVQPITSEFANKMLIPQLYNVMHSVCTIICRDHWYSSLTYAAGFAINHIVHSSILFSGLGFQQFLRFCKFVCLGHTAPNTYRFQRLYAAPTVNQEYTTLKSKIVKGLKLWFCCFRWLSYGFSWLLYCEGTYTLMNHETGTLISMHHGDKRQVTYTICLLYCCYCSVIIGEFKVNKSRVSF